MATVKSKTEYVQEALDKGIVLTGTETVAELKELLSDDLEEHAAPMPYVAPRILTGDPEKDATNEYERLCAVYNKYRSRYPEKWEANKADLLEKLDAVAQQLNIKNNYE